MTQGDDEAWRRKVDGTLTQVKEARLKDRVEWLRKRSEWLQSSALEEVGRGLRAGVERVLTKAEASVQRMPETLATLLADRALHDYELRIAVERALRAGLSSGDDDLLTEVLRIAAARLARVAIPGHRAGCIGACIRAAATLGDAAMVDRLLGDVVALAGSPEAPPALALLLAVTPGLVALRRTGVSASARRFLEALVPHAQRGHSKGLKLRAALAEGHLILGETEHATRLLDEVIDDTTSGAFDHLGRYNVGVSLLAALKHWPIAQRAPRCERVLAALDRFTDGYTASAQKLYETHKILIAERIIDCVLAPDAPEVAWLDAQRDALLARVLAEPLGELQAIGGIDPR